MGFLLPKLAFQQCKTFIIVTKNYRFALPGDYNEVALTTSQQLINDPGAGTSVQGQEGGGVGIMGRNVAERRVIEAGKGWYQQQCH